MDGSVEIYFDPQKPKENGNWIRAVPGEGWFAYFRFCGPTEAFSDPTWKLVDVLPLPSAETKPPER
jgi:hypothetical protein